MTTPLLNTYCAQSSFSHCGDMEELEIHIHTGGTDILVGRVSVFILIDAVPSVVSRE